MNLYNKKVLKSSITIMIVIIAVIISMIFITNIYMINSTEALMIEEINDDKQIFLSNEKVNELKKTNVECIIVLGAGLKPDGTPNHMLEDRLEVGLSLYNQGIAPKLLLTGDNGQEDYDEVNAMKKYMLDNGVKDEDIFLDHAGFSTYESMYRAKEIFDVNEAIVVTQKYHQYRAIYIAEQLGYNVYGISSDQRRYAGQDVRDLRENLARTKDFIKTIFKPTPTYLGDVISISGNGLESWD